MNQQIPDEDKQPKNDYEHITPKKKSLNGNGKASSPLISLGNNSSLLS